MPGRKRRRVNRVTREELRKAVWSAGEALLAVRPEREGRRERATPYLIALLGKLQDMEASTYTETSDTDRPLKAEETPGGGADWQDLPTLDSPPDIRVERLLHGTRKEVMLVQEGPPQYIPATTIQYPDQRASMAAQSEAMSMVDNWIIEALDRAGQARES